ncbi:MAG: tRNA preQ1(34) S-adenosylmethionine ribosyltransferase-isomerase QueA [Candidatus Omnitrophica bacterium]|nr:tRNA preQ1(34) S-adenosylmethionine ribosyltransferase-isomerase QueA [Candidatus Omnitrophota bacterium]
MKTHEFFYTLPKELIAQEPLEKRDESRLLVIFRKERIFKEVIFKEIIDYLKPTDVLVLNETKVIPARLKAKRNTGGKVEVLLLKEKNTGIWQALLKPTKRIKISETIFFDNHSFSAKILERNNQGIFYLEFIPKDIKPLIYLYGQMPTPPYIKIELKQPHRYQTVYAKKEGSVASPTAGLHFTEELLKKIEQKGIEIVYLSLHCGLSTFRPLKKENLEEHSLEPEYLEIPKETARVINQAKLVQKRIIAVGTTVARALESTAFLNEENIFQIKPFKGETSLFIYPGYQFKIIDCLLTNFHLPCSTNLVLTCAFADKELIFSAYQYAIERKFRFYSFGDATFII